MSDESRNESEGLWTAKQVASFLSLHPNTVYKMERAGELPSVRIGTALRFPVREIRALAEPGEDRGMSDAAEAKVG